MKTIERMNYVYVLRWFEITKLYANKAFESCQPELPEMGIELVCCDGSAHVHFAERGIRFIKERIQCVQINAAKGNQNNFKKTNDGTSIRYKYYDQLYQKGWRYSSCYVTLLDCCGKKTSYPTMPTEIVIYKVPRNTWNSFDKIWTFDALYIRLNKEGGDILCTISIRCSKTQFIESLVSTRSQSRWSKRQWIQSIDKQ